MVKCDKCGSEDTYKLSQIYATSTLVVETDTSNSGIGVTSSGNLGVGIGESSTSGTIRSLRGLSSAPPKEPFNPPLGCLEPLVIFIIIICLAVLASIKRFEGVCSITTLMCITFLMLFLMSFLMLTLGAYAIYKWLSNRTKKQMKQYQTEFDTWNKKWACNRCGNIFIP